MADSFTKKENNKKRALKKKFKDLKKKDRKVNNNKGKGFESMIVYVDDQGQLTSTPPEIKKPTESKITPRVAISSATKL
ncbi:MAG: hypothetical protein CFE24_13695 [Flavobacterium sp. BFFFF2]|nr:MAG: hypothetical protein CFE24_13695 [Flavobacterium sp. BFFFF2]